MNRRFAEATAVPVSRSKVEIEKILARYGADQFATGWNESGAMVGFRAHERMVRFAIPLEPKPSGGAGLRKWEQEERRRWRVLLLAIKAKLEFVASGMSVFEQEFLGHIVVPGGRTVYEETSAAIAKSYKLGKSQSLLPAWEGEPQS